MSPLHWALRAFNQYATFRGRARRREYWWFAALYLLAMLAGALIGGIIGAIFGASEALARLAYVAVGLVGIIPAFAVTVRRLHDTGKSGWWYLITLIPFVGGIVVFVFLCLDSSPGTNRWGPNPKQSDMVSLVNQSYVV